MFIGGGGVVGRGNVKRMMNKCCLEGEISLGKCENVGGMVGERG